MAVEAKAAGIAAATAAAYAAGPAGAAAALVVSAGADLVSYATNVGEYTGLALAALPPILGVADAAYISKYVAARPKTYFEKAQNDYCRKTGCEPKAFGFELWDPGYDKKAAGASLAQSFYNLTTQQQYLGRPEADGWRVKAAVYEVFGNKTRAAEAAAKAAQLGGSVVTAAQTVAQAKANAGRPPSAAEEAAAQRAAQEPMLIGWPGRYWPPAVGVELSYGAASRPTPSGGTDFAQDGTWGRALLKLVGNKYVYDLNEKYNFAMFGLSKEKLAAVNAGLKDDLLAQAGNTDAELQRQTWFRIARERLLKAGVPSGQIAAVYGVGPGLPADTQPEPDGLPLTPAGTSPATLAVAKPSRPLWHYIAAGLVTIVVIGGVIYVVRK